MRKKILAAIGAPILLASTLLAGSAAAKPSHRAVVKAPKAAVCSTTCPSDEIFFHGIVQFLPSADSPKAYVIIQDPTVKNGPLPCAQYSDGGEGPFACTGTSHGTITNPGGVITFTGTTTFASNDGVITITGSVPVRGKATITSCKEFDIPEAITTTGCTITNGSYGVTLFPAGSPPVYHIYADIIINEVPGVGKDID